MSFTRKVAHNTAYQFVGKVANLLVGLVAFGILTRYLGRGVFGDYATILAYLGFFATLGDFGLYLVGIREMAKNEKEASKIFSDIFSLRLLITIGALLIGIGISFAFPYSNLLRLGLLIGAISFLFVYINQLYAGLFQKNLDTRKLVWSELLGRIIFLGGVVLISSFGYGLLAVVVALAVGNFFTFILNYIFGGKHVQVRLRFAPGAWKRIIKIAIPIAAAAIFNVIYFKFDTVILSIFQPSEDVGIYGASYKVIEILVAFPAIFTGLLLATMTNTIKKTRERFESVFQKGYNALTWVAFPALVGGIVLAPQIISLISGSEYVPSIYILQILLLAIPFMFIGNLGHIILVASDQQRKLAWIFFIGAVLSLATNLIFIPLYSYTGAAITTVVVEVVVTIITYATVVKITKYCPKQGILIRSLLASLIMGAILYILPIWNIFVLVAIGVVVYGLVLYILKGVSKETVKEVITLRRSS